MLTTIINKPRTATLVPTMAEKLGRSMAKMSKVLLFNALACNGTAYVHINGIKCILCGMVRESGCGMVRESGSGNSFILSLYGPDGKSYQCHTYTY